MAYRRGDMGFGSGLGPGFGSGGGYDPHRAWEGPWTTRGVVREGSRVPREHDDEHPQSQRNYAHGPEHPHFSEETARSYQQHGYGLSQYPDSEIDRGPHYGKGPKGYKRPDERIREEVCEAMSRQGYIDASDVEVTVENGVVRLAGTVASRSDKRGLEQIADRVHGVEEVRNEIRLRHLVGSSTPSQRAAVPPSDARRAH
jgi:hypothetical protein